MEGNTTFVSDGSDMIKPEVYILSGDELRRTKVMNLRREFLNIHGEDYLTENCAEASTLFAGWEAAANASYPTNGNYKIDSTTLANLGPVTEEVEFIEVPTCPTSTLVIQVCNSNALMDDNFDVVLNGTTIGTLDLSTNAQVGSVFLANLDPFLNVTSPDFACPMTLMVTFRYSPSIVKVRGNVLQMVNTQNNGNGNLGSIGIRHYEISGEELINPCVVADLNYSGGSGDSFEFTFDYRNCQ